VAHANLLRLIGLPLATRLEPTEPLAAAAPPREDAETLLANAVEARAEIAALRARAAALEASARAARGATLPQASLSAAYEYANPNTRILPLASEWKGTWNVAASVSITAFDGGRAAAAVAQAQSQADAARYQMEDLSRRIRLEVTSRLLDLDMSWAAIEVAERSLEAARENVRVSRDRFGEGLIPSSELLDAETALLRAGLDRTAAFAGLHLAAADLDRAVGR
jgi:outer membrane protein TolC